MNPWARGVAIMARGPGGVDAEYRVRGEGPPVHLRLMLEKADEEQRSRVATVTAALVSDDAVRALTEAAPDQIGRPERGDTITIPALGKAWKVETPQAGLNGWAWRLPLTLLR
ncbi:head-tail joining protein [Roseomonas populi]|uniref:Uncharacterized protein n=1 Tax=Roseomonas populi TaxID=3121582 RepID=A0ABT1X117_9PROT|nr:hypothetical protein [Roseomonas pecuniae]MCR0981794.1 hypothetical protein [Roseomonas pecuniae]